jgi:hypothetical protein
MSKFITLLTILSLLLALPVQAQEATSETTPFVFYNSPADRFHVLIPPGWENHSTDTYAHFVSGTEQIYVLPARTGSTADGMQTALETVGVTLNPFAESQVRVSNGTWTQKLYAPEDGSAVTAFGQSFEGMTYTIVYVSESGARPLMAQSADTLAGVEAALALIDVESAPDDLAEAPTTQWIDIQADPYRVTARSSGSATFAFVQPADSDALPDVFFYTMLVDFFVTPETTDYMTLGLAATGIILLVIVGTMWLRWRNLHQDMRTLEQLGNEGA